MVTVHLVYDLTELHPILHWNVPPLFLWIKNRGGTAFLLICGICATLGRRSLRRGAIVFGCGLLVTAVTWLCKDPIWFGALHCLGACMALWTIFRRWGNAALGLWAAALIGLGLWFEQIHVPFPQLFWLGLTAPAFSAPDFFPLLPNLGFFLLGTLLGRTLYPQKRTRFPGIDPERPILRAARWCGRHALPIYLLHQPVLLLSIGLMDA